MIGGMRVSDKKKRSAKDLNLLTQERIVLCGEMWHHYLTVIQLVTGSREYEEKET